MRATLLLTGLLLALAAVPAGSALVGPSCTDANSTTSINFAWVPSCLRIVSGDTITFDNADNAAHNARSSQDTMISLPGVTPCFQTPNFDNGRTAQVRFTHDSDGVTASVRQPNGSWSTPVDCDLAEDPVTSLTGTTEAAIPFECGIHQAMTGTIRVAMTGGSVG